MFSFVFSFVCQYLLIFAFVNFLHFFTNIHKTSKISSQCQYTPHHTVLPLGHFLATLISCPWSGLNPTGDSQVRTIGTIPFVVPVPVTPHQFPPRCLVGHTMPIGATTVPVPNHAQAGARLWPRPRRRDTILIPLLMGVA